MSAWLTAHTQGWPIFLATTAGLSAAAAVAYARGRSSRVPWLFLAAWILGVAAFYVTTHLDRQRVGWPRMWSGQLLTIAVAVGFPLILVVVVLALYARKSQTRWPRAAGVATAIGAASMALAPTISQWMFHLLLDWIMAGRPGPAA